MTRRSALAAAAMLAALTACPREPEPVAPAPVPPTAVPPPGATPLSPAPVPAPSPPGPTPGPLGARAAGFPCATDADLQCAWGRCVGGRCGGCAGDAECKPGARCAATPFGAACLLGAPPPVGPAPSPTPAPSPPPVPPPAPADPLEAARQSCLDRINGYRARVGAPALARRAEREVCVDQEAATDGRANQPHGSFGRCQEGAQNVCPGYRGSLETILSSCLQQMFNEGPGEPYSAHGHYLNMTSTAYRSAACGFFTAPDGSTWVVQDFFR